MKCEGAVIRQGSWYVRRVRLGKPDDEVCVWDVRLDLSMLVAVARDGSKFAVDFAVFESEYREKVRL